MQLASRNICRDAPRDAQDTQWALTWRKSTASNPSGNCVELAELAGGQIALRNSRFPAGPVLVGTRDAVAAFLRAARSGEFDDLGG
ncbi:DUF397 domain-containing protein [Pseudonocardia sichuanensis]|uniref:Uncharacterized protein DUF397 n=1 Tax=Pseudonocardia kunmingensis TaxID=630975 RepID=A0A543D4I2_9PSEU|nr:uncharacterized protein DUF397 [Pseudonocardia kunmingensis]